ncbi:transposase [uncultured Gimesia sp.]|uniref:transposase n=1 Tax=uncultured Gimesia sp. TaxID=1678688 RepID=UPI0030D87593|tara:strand:- start:40519 stop:41199 length:681 start_codon:yes stop_codon:yes gene_type:complete
MPRSKRICPAGEVFHVLNRSVARLTLFEKPDDYAAFMQVVEETWQKNPLPIFAMSVMPNHWHFVVRPTTDTQLTEFFQRLTVTHTMRWHSQNATGGTGHLYQGRFKSFPIQPNEHLLTVMRYVERNPLQAKLVKHAEEWEYSSAWARQQKQAAPAWLATPKKPPLPRNWRALVNKPQTDAELVAVRKCIVRGTPFGGDKWISNTAVRLALESTTRPRGRPRLNKES